MLDDDTILPFDPPVIDWQADIRAALNGQLQLVARAMGADNACETLDIALIKLNVLHTTVRLDAGDAQAVLKLFVNEAGAAKEAYLREKAALIQFRGSDLVPNLLAFNDEDRMILTRYVPHLDVEAGIREHGADIVAYQLGVWHAELEQASPVFATRGTWLSYLEKFKRLNLDVLEEHAIDLAAVPLCGQVLARGDGSLTNSLVIKRGLIVGVDFAAAKLRPRGWDMMASCIALTQRFPAMAGEMMDFMVAGYAKTNKGAVNPAELRQVAKLVHLALALEGPEQVAA